MSHPVIGTTNRGAVFKPGFVPGCQKDSFKMNVSFPAAAAQNLGTYCQRPIVLDGAGGASGAGAGAGVGAAVAGAGAVTVAGGGIGVGTGTGIGIGVGVGVDAGTGAGAG